MAEEAKNNPTVTVDPEEFVPARFTHSKEELKLEQEMVKTIESMHENCRDRFKCLHVWSDERSVINDTFEMEVRALSEAFEKRKVPLLLKRD